MPTTAGTPFLGAVLALSAVGWSGPEPGPGPTIETVLARVENDHETHPFYRMVSESDGEGRLVAVHFDSYSRDDGGFVGRVWTVGVGSLGVEGSYRVRRFLMRFTAFKFVPHVSDPLAALSFTLLYRLNFLDFFGADYGELRLAIVNTADGWILVDEDGRRVDVLFANVSRTGIRSIVPTGGADGPPRGNLAPYPWP